MFFFVLYRYAILQRASVRGNTHRGQTKSVLPVKRGAQVTIELQLPATVFCIDDKVDAPHTRANKTYESFAARTVRRFCWLGKVHEVSSGH